MGYIITSVGSGRQTNQLSVPANLYTIGLARQTILDVIDLGVDISKYAVQII